MSVNDFLSKNNVQLIWEILIDEDIFKNRTKDIITNIQISFNKIIKDFYDSEKNKYSDLMNMNKQFIKIILNYINKYFPLKQNTTSISNIPYQNNSLITSEDIQQNRISQFEKELSIKQQEFTNAITLPVPPTPNFSDKLDEPIGEIGLAIKQMMAQRKYDTELINQNINKNDSSNWLRSQETSVKNDRLNVQQNNNTQNINNKSNENIKNMNNIADKYVENYMNNSKIKYIKIDNKDIIDIDIQREAIDLNKKQLSWSADNITIEYNELDSIDNDSKLDNNDDNNNNNIDSNNILNKLKLLPNDSNKTSKNTNYYTRLENKVDNLNNKLDMILKLLERKI